MQAHVYHCQVFGGPSCCRTGNQERRERGGEGRGGEGNRVRDEEGRGGDRRAKGGEFH